LVLGDLFVLAGVEGGVVRDVDAHFVGTLDEIVAEVAVAGLGHTAILSFEVTGVVTRPPEAGDLGDGILSIAEVAGAVAFALFVPFERLEEAVDGADLGADAGGEDRTVARDGGELGDRGIV